MQATKKIEIGPWLALFHLTLSLRLSHQLLLHFGEIDALLAAKPPALRALGVPEAAIFAFSSYQSKMPKALTQAIEESLAWANQPQRHILCLDDTRYPQALKEISCPPLLLFVEGEASLLSQPQIALVGSRHASHAGLENARWFAKELARQGLVVTSGLALGIDGAGHEGALAGGGQTLAVMATGMDRIYPSRHQDLALRIKGQGALISEFPLGTAPVKANFPRRNRIISGLAQGVLVVEAALRSGSLVTARCAAEQGREVFAVPGSIHQPTSHGCHALIRQGAKLVESVQDILEELPGSFGARQGKTRRSAGDGIQLSPELRQLLDCVDFEPTPIDLILQRCDAEVVALSPLLMQLELEGYICATTGGFVKQAGIDKT